MIQRLILTSVCLFLLGVCLRMSLRLLYGARGPAPDDGVYFLLRIIGWSLMVIPAIVLVVAGANWLSFVLIAAIIEAAVQLTLARREAQRQAVWRLVAGAISGGRSLANVLQIHQARFSGIVGRWQRRLVDDLERGMPWRQAIWRNRKAFPREAPTAASMATIGGKPDDAVAELGEIRDPAYHQLQQETSLRFMYLMNVCAVMLAVVTFVMIKIIPSFQSIFEDFDLELPAITVSVIIASNAIATVLGGAILALFLLAALAGLVIAVFYLCDIPVLRRLTDRLFFSRHRAEVMRLLAAGFEQGKPVDQSLAHLAIGWAPYPSKLVRRRLNRAADRIVAGDEWQRSLANASLVSNADATVLRAAQAVGNLPWALRMLASRKMRLATFRWAIVQQIIFVLLVLSLGLLVFVFAVAMMVPLASLVANLSG
jgi:type II secretory pathway component PulF